MPFCSGAIYILVFKRTIVIDLPEINLYFMPKSERTLKNNRVAVLGASPKRNRYSNMAVRQLAEKGYSVIPVNPAYDEIEGIRAVPDINSIDSEVDTLTMYVNPYLGEKAVDDILTLSPRRVIFNPGSEAPGLMKALEKAGIEYIEACTLVMLSTGQFAN